MRFFVRLGGYAVYLLGFLSLLLRRGPYAIALLVVLGGTYLAMLHTQQALKSSKPVARWIWDQADAWCIFGTNCTGSGGKISGTDWNTARTTAVKSGDAAGGGLSGTYPNPGIALSGVDDSVLYRQDAQTIGALANVKRDPATGGLVATCDDTATDCSEKVIQETTPPDEPTVDGECRWLYYNDGATVRPCLRCKGNMGDMTCYSGTSVPLSPRPVIAAQAVQCTDGTPNTTLSISSFNTNCTNCYLTVSIHTRGTSTAHACTFNAAPVNDLSLNDVNSGEETQLFGELLASSVTSNIACNWTETREACVAAVSWSNVHRTTPVGVTNTVNGTSLSGATVTLAATQANGTSYGALTRFSATEDAITVGPDDTEVFNTVTNNAASNSRAVTMWQATGSGGDIDLDGIWSASISRPYSFCAVTLRGL